MKFDIVLVIEPTSPLRKSEDIEETTMKLIYSNAYSAVTVSKINSQNHPNKVFEILNDRLNFFSLLGSEIRNRQELNDLYYRNGCCYAIFCEPFKKIKAIISKDSIPVLIDRYVANIDEEIDLAWAEFLITQEVQ